MLMVLSACLNVYSKVTARSLDPHEPVTVTTPVKAHLLDGSTVVFAKGVTVGDGAVRGEGYRYGLTLRDSSTVLVVPLDSVVGMEVFEQQSDPVKSFFVTTLATAGALMGAGALAVAIFGSCPTFYADSAGIAYLQAEGFSYSIAPIFESRDLDRLRVRTAADGSVRLEVRNEALETHYLNQLELLTVEHDSFETALIDEANRPVVVGRQYPLVSAIDRRGRDASRVLRSEDGSAYRTDARTLNRAELGDLDDWIDLSVPAPAHGDSVAIVLRLRNSLLNTTLLYDVMLGEPGARSLDWIGRDLKEVGPALDVAQWYQQRMGMDIAVATDAASGGYRTVAHVKDTGPIAWKDMVVVVPVLTRDTVRIRLRFPVDNWRIDRAAVALEFRRVSAAVVPLTRVETGDAAQDAGALASMRAADNRYLQTTPGQRLTAVFEPGTRAMSGGTFFLASQGYYIEWVRRSWMVAPLADRPFAPSDSALARAVARWRTTQDSLETLFDATRIPVR